MPEKLMPDQHRQPGESAVKWANRLRVQRGVHGVEWYERADGGLALRARQEPQPRLDF